MRYVIIGNSTAAAGCVEGIREIDRKGSITIISEEPYHVYSRPLISYLLQGKTDEQRMKYRPDQFYADNGCTVLLGKKAVKIDPAAGHVLLDGGEEVVYDKLLVATGSSPFLPPMKGIETVQSRFSFMTLDDAKALDTVLDKDKRVIIIGGGLIGLKCAEGINERVKSITVVDLAPSILSSILDNESAGFVQKHLEAHGISFRLGTSVQEFKGSTAVLTTGEELSFDILVTAVGVRPNTALVKDAGGSVNKGIVVNSRMETSLKNIYAAGDCTENYDISSSTDRVLALFPNAYHGGLTAGVNMAGGSMVFDKAMPMNAIGFFGLHIITAGTYKGDMYEECGSESIKKLFYENDLLKGFIMIGDVSRAGIYTSLIRERTPLSSIDYTLLFRQPCLAAFSRKFRDEKLGGVK